MTAGCRQQPTMKGPTYRRCCVGPPFPSALALSTYVASTNATINKWVCSHRDDVCLRRSERGIL